MAGEGGYRVEFRTVAPDGRVRWIESIGRVLRDDDGRPYRFDGVTMNVTDRKLAEAALRESEGRFRTLADSAPVMIWMAGPDKVCTYFNRPWLEFTGRTLAEELDNGWAEGIHVDDYERCLGTYSRAFDARESFEMEYRLRRFDGVFRWVLDNAIPLFGPEGDFAGYIG
jgi:PAS domain S-box-containing protein